MSGLDQTARGKFVARDAVIGSDSGGKGLELPIVVQAPQDVTVWEHQPAPLSVTATGTGITYQWQRNGANIARATSASYTLPCLFDAAVRHWTCQRLANCE